MTNTELIDELRLYAEESPEAKLLNAAADACSSVLRKLENEAKTNTEKLCYGYAAKMFEEAFTIIAAERKDDGTTAD